MSPPLSNEDIQKLHYKQIPQKTKTNLIDIKTYFLDNSILTYYYDVNNLHTSNKSNNSNNSNNYYTKCLAVVR